MHVITVDTNRHQSSGWKAASPQKRSDKQAARARRVGRGQAPTVTSAVPGRAGLSERETAHWDRCLARKSNYAGYGSSAASPPVTVCHSPLPHDGQGEGVWWSRRRFDCRISCIRMFLR
jgi:hypothetical protein